MVGISGTSIQAVFVYLWICVFVYLKVLNIIFYVLGLLAFQKYSIIRFYKVFWAWWRTNDKTTGWTKCKWNAKKSRLLQKHVFILNFFFLLPEVDCCQTHWSCSHPTTVVPVQKIIGHSGGRRNRLVINSHHKIHVNSRKRTKSSD